MNNRVTADIGLLLIALVWGSTFGVTKAALAAVDPMWFLFIRFAAATACLVPVYVARRLHRRRSLTNTTPGLRQSIRPGVLLGLVFAVGYIAQTEGLRLTSATASGFITGMNVVFVAIMHALLTRRLPPPRSQIGVLLATTGLLTITVSQGFTLGRGDLITLVCAVFFGLHIVATERYTHQVDPVAVVLVQTALIALITLVLSSARGVSVRLSDAPASAIWAALYCGVFATSLALVVQTVAQRVTSAIETAIAYSMEPVFSALFAFALFGEDPGIKTLIGGVMILAGIITVNLSKSRQLLKESCPETPLYGDSSDSKRALEASSLRQSARRP